MIPTQAKDRRSYIKNNILPNLDLRPFINGEHNDTNGHEYLDIIDPMQNTVLVKMPLCNEKDIDKAVDSAKEAFESDKWSTVHPRERARIIFKLADLIEENIEELALLEAVDVGKSISGIKGWDIPNAAEVYRYYAGWADKIVGNTYPSVSNFNISSKKEPVGVCAAIMPWNFPFACLAWKIAPALAAGCTVVVKSSERAPLTTQYLAKLIIKAGFPAGVINITMGLGEIAGNALVSNSKVNKISLTGDVLTAKKILKSSSNHLPRLSFELGGKSPNIICKDANINNAVNGTISAIFDVAGQNCLAGSRTFIHEDIYDDFIKKLTEKTLQRKLGDPLDDTTEQGPQIDTKHINRIKGYVQDALKDGGHCLTGGIEPTTKGELFFAPTLMTNIDDNMKISREEVFGPVGIIYKFKDIEEVIKRANDTDYGLAAAIWTNQKSNYDNFINNIKAGTCWINCYGIIDTVAPWGGYKQSGYGKELGYEGIEDFLETKIIVHA